MAARRRKSGVAARLAAAAALALVLGTPGFALADTSVSMVDSNGAALAGAIDINDLENGRFILVGEGDWAGNVQGVWINLKDSSGNRVSGAIDASGGFCTSTAVGFDADIRFNSGVLQPGETYTITVEYRDFSNNAVGYGEFTFTVGGSASGGSETTPGTGGGDGGGDGTGSGDGAGSGSDTGGGDSSSGSDGGSGGGVIWGGDGGSGSIIWGDSGSGESAGTGDSGSNNPAGDSGTSNDPVITEPEPDPEPGESAGDDSTGAVADDDASQVTDDGSMDSTTVAAAAVASKGGGGGADGNDPESESKEQATQEEQTQQEAQTVTEDTTDGTVLAELGQVYQLFNKPLNTANPVSQQIQPAIAVTGIPWLLAAMLALLLIAGPAGLARRFVGYRRGLSAPTRLRPAAAAAGSAPDPDPATFDERHDA